MQSPCLKENLDGRHIPQTGFLITSGLLLFRGESVTHGAG
jgi:hypothetical protein